MRKPAVKTDLIPPFQSIGEERWIRKFKQILINYGIQAPKPVNKEIVQGKEKELGFQFPHTLRIFLVEIGCANLNDFCIYPLHEMKTLEDICFRDSLTLSEQKQLSDLLGIADSGSDNVIAIAPDTDHCYLCSHDPAGLYLKAKSFDDLLQQVIIDLSWGYYGWPDPYIEQLASELKNDLFGKSLTNL